MKKERICNRIRHAPKRHELWESGPYIGKYQLSRDKDYTALDFTGFIRTKSVLYREVVDGKKRLLQLFD